MLNKHSDNIDKMAKKHNVDPDLVRAVMWVENSTGNKAGLNQIADDLNLSKSQAPMNINGKIWGKLVDKKDAALNNPEENIEAATILLGRIKDRIKNPNATKIGSVWNYTGREHANPVGIEIGRIHEEKPWNNK